MNSLDLVNWPADRALIVSGTPRGLRIPVTIRNPAARQEAQAVLEGLTPVGGGERLAGGYATVQLSVPENGTASVDVRLRLDPSTPPGRYEGEMAVAGLRRSVAIDVLPETKLNVRPSPAVMDAAAGLDLELIAAFENRGNVPLVIDLAGDYPLGEEILLISERPAEGAGNALAVAFEQLLPRSPALRITPAGSARLAMPNGRLHLGPGESDVVRVRLHLPEGLSPTARYHLVAPLYTSDLHIVIVTAAKPAVATKPARRVKGTAA